MASYWIKLYTEFVNDPKMRRLTLEQRGLWISLLCLAGQSPRFGSLYLSEKIPYTIADIIDAVGIRGEIKRVNEFVTDSMNQFDLLDMVQHDERGGIMIKNFAKRQGSEHPAMVRERVTRHRLKQNGNESVTDVTGLDIDIDIDIDKDIDTFERFWNAYPNKKQKKKAEEKYLRIVKKKPGLAATILAALEVQKKSPQWTKDAGQFIPHPTTWLNGERWNDVVETKNKNDKYAKINSTTIRQ